MDPTPDQTANQTANQDTAATRQTSPAQQAYQRALRAALNQSGPTRLSLPPRTLDDIELRPAERAFLVGMTETGKSTLLDALIAQSRRAYPDQLHIIYDSKPRWHGTRELSGLPTWARYRQWDDAKGTELPGSVVLPAPDESVLPADYDARAEHDVRWAWRFGHKTILAQATHQRELPWLSAIMRASYEHKPKNAKLMHVVDEGNHFFRNGRATGGIIVEMLTSGRENGVGVLLGGQRPRNISVEAMESLTNLYWFHTPARDDVKHLHHMGVPLDARPGAEGSNAFYFYSRKRPHRGLCRLHLAPSGDGAAQEVPHG